MRRRAGPPEPWRLIAARFRIPVFLFSLSVAYGIAGYMALEGFSLVDALYMTLITLTTVGFGEVRPLGTHGRMFTVTLMVFGVVTLFAMIGVLAQMLAAGELREPVRRRRMAKRIDGLSDHYVICAYGRVGRAAALELTQQGVRFVVVEAKAELVGLMEEQSIAFLNADPTEESVLREAGLERAKGLICAVDSDAINVYIALTGRAINPGLAIVARASAPESIDKLYRAGADRVVSPYETSGKRMATLALQPAVVEFFDMLADTPDLRLEEIAVRPGSILDGATVGGAVAAIAGVAIIALRKAGGTLLASPGHDAVLAPGDLVVAIGPARSLAAMAR